MPAAIPASELAFGPAGQEAIEGLAEAVDNFFLTGCDPVEDMMAERGLASGHGSPVAIAQLPSTGLPRPPSTADTRATLLTAAAADALSRSHLGSSGMEEQVDQIIIAMQTEPQLASSQAHHHSTRCIAWLSLRPNTSPTHASRPWATPLCLPMRL